MLLICNTPHRLPRLFKLTLAHAIAGNRLGAERGYSSLARKVLIPMDCPDKPIFRSIAIPPCDLADTESGLMTPHCPQTDDFSRQIRWAGAVLSDFRHWGAAQ